MSYPESEWERAKKGQAVLTRKLKPASSIPAHHQRNRAPSLGRSRAVSGARRSHEEPGDAQILVGLRPVDPLTVAQQLESGSRIGCCGDQAWKPHQRHAQAPAVSQVDAQFVGRDFHSTRERAWFRNRRTHARPPTTCRGARRPGRAAVSVPGKQTPLNLPARAVPARTLPRTWRLARGRVNGAPDRIRTCGLRLRRPTLYPAELRAHLLGARDWALGASSQGASF